jgi:hypothetical protein
LQEVSAGPIGKAFADTHAALKETIPRPSVVGDEIKETAQAFGTGVKQRLSAGAQMVKGKLVGAGNYVKGSLHGKTLKQARINLIEANVECNSEDEYLGWFSTLEKCAAQAEEEGGRYFLYGHGAKKWLCWMEHPQSRDCPEGLMKDNYNFYELVYGEPEAEPDTSENVTTTGGEHPLDGDEPTVDTSTAEPTSDAAAPPSNVAVPPPPPFDASNVSIPPPPSFNLSAVDLPPPPTFLNPTPARRSEATTRAESRRLQWRWFSNFFF